MSVLRRGERRIKIITQAMGGKPDTQSEKEREAPNKKKHQKNARCAVLIIKREQQFGIFIYCNVILESFFISNGWFLNEKL
jgi:hypothetical protein